MASVNWARGGFWLFAFTRQLKTRSLLPIHEPSLKELHHTVAAFIAGTANQKSK